VKIFGDLKNKLGEIKMAKLDTADFTVVVSPRAEAVAWCLFGTHINLTLVLIERLSASHLGLFDRIIKFELFQKGFTIILACLGFELMRISNFLITLLYQETINGTFDARNTLGVLEKLVSIVK